MAGKQTKIQGVPDEWLDTLMQGLNKAERLYMVKLPGPGLPESVDAFIADSLMEVKLEDVAITVNPYADEVVVRAYCMPGGAAADGMLYTDREAAVQAILKRLDHVLELYGQKLADLKAAAASR